MIAESPAADKHEEVASYGPEQFARWMRNQHPHTSGCGCIRCADLRAEIRRQTRTEPEPALDWRGEPLPPAEAREERAIREVRRSA